MIIIIRPYKLVQAQRTLKPYAIEVSDSLALTGLPSLISMRPVTTDTANVGASVESISLFISAEDYATKGGAFADSMNTAAGLDAGQYTIDAGYGSINGGSDKLNTGSGLDAGRIDITASYFTYTNPIEALNSGAGLDAGTIDITASYYTYSAPIEALNTNAGLDAGKIT